MDVWLDWHIAQCTMAIRSLVTVALVLSTVYDVCVVLCERYAVDVVWQTLVLDSVALPDYLVYPGLSPGWVAARQQ